MEQDEIIQQKEWSELTPAEMQVVQELAENEQEYNLLKKIMQVSAEEPAAAPAISSSVRDNLAEMVREQKPSAFRRYRYLAAAAVAALIFAGVFIFPKKIDNTGVAVITPKPNDTAAIVKAQSSAAPDNTAAPAPFDSAANLAEQKKHLVPIQLNVPAEDQPSPEKPTAAYASANVHVSDDPALLNLVTEIY